MDDHEFTIVSLSSRTSQHNGEDNVQNLRQNMLEDACAPLIPWTYPHAIILFAWVNELL
jgi:hypothetical protein